MTRIGQTISMAERARVRLAQPAPLLLVHGSLASSRMWTPYHTGSG